MLEQDSAKVSSSNTSSGGSSSVSLAPKWIYGTTLPPLNASRNELFVGFGLVSKRARSSGCSAARAYCRILFPTTSFVATKGCEIQGKYWKYIIGGYNSVKKSAFKNPLLVITGPSFITDANQAKACAQWVGSMNGKKFHDLPNGILPDSILGLYHRSNRLELKNILLSLRTNLTKYNHGYNDRSFLRGFNSIMTYEIEQGIPICRALLCELAEICPIVGETSDTITPQYFSDLFCLGIVSSKLRESQLHQRISIQVFLTLSVSTPWMIHCALIKNFIPIISPRLWKQCMLLLIPINFYPSLKSEQLQLSGLLVTTRHLLYY